MLPLQRQASANLRPLRRVPWRRKTAGDVGMAPGAFAHGTRPSGLFGQQEFASLGDLQAIDIAVVVDVDARRITQQIGQLQRFS